MTTELYVCRCICDREIRSVARTGRCACGRMYVLVWPAPDGASSRGVTIAAKYEESGQ